MDSTKKIKWSSWKTAIDTLERFTNGSEKDCRFEGRWKLPWIYAACFVNSCHRKDAGVFFRLNKSIHQHTGDECDTSF